MIGFGVRIALDWMPDDDLVNPFPSEKRVQGSLYLHCSHFDIIIMFIHPGGT